MNLSCLMPLLLRAIGRLALGMGLVCLAPAAWAQAKAADVTQGEVTLQTQYWVDEGGQAGIEQVAKAAPGQFVPVETFSSFTLQKNSA